MKFSEFNKVVNPGNDSCYIVETTRGNFTKPITGQAVIALLKTYTEAMIHWVIPKGFYVIETKENSILNIIQTRKDPVIVISNKGNSSLYIICKGSFNKTTKNNMLSCGINCNIISHNRNQNKILLPYKLKSNISQILNKLTLEYSNPILADPCWLRPIYKTEADTARGIELPIKNNTQNILSHILSKLGSYNTFEKEDIAYLINDNFCDTPLSEAELDNMLSRTSADVLAQFFDKGNFLHDKLGNYIIEECDIKFDTITEQIFYYDKRKNIYVSQDNYIKSFMTKLCPQLKNHQKDEVLKYIKDLLYTESDYEFNSNPYTIVFKNGILDISTQIFEPMSPEHLESIQLNCDYNPSAYSKTVDEFFATATRNNKDTELLLYQALGYAMLKTSELAKAFICTGSGRNGKSTYFDLSRALLGDRNTTSLTFKDLNNNFRSSSLFGKLASYAGDISKQTLADTDLFKNIASGDKILVERKYKDAVDVRLFSTMFYACNELPGSPDTSDGFYRRCVIIPFNADLSNVSEVQGMKFKKDLTSNASLEYAAYKAVLAITEVLNTTCKFVEPQEVKEMKEAYRIKNSSVRLWFAEMIKTTNELKRLGLAKAYLSYKNWCEESNKKKLSKAVFEERVKNELKYTFSS